MLFRSLKSTHSPLPGRSSHGMALARDPERSKQRVCLAVVKHTSLGTNVFARARQSCEKCPTNPHPHRLTQPPPLHMCNSFTPPTLKGGRRFGGKEKKFKSSGLTLIAREYMDQEKVDRSEMGARDGKGWMGGGTVESFWTSNDRRIGQTAFVPVIPPILHFTRPPRKLLPPPSVASASCHRNIKTQKKSSSCFPLQVFFFWVNSLLFVVGTASMEIELEN